MLPEEVGRGAREYLPVQPCPGSVIPARENAGVKIHALWRIQVNIGKRLAVVVHVVGLV